MAGNTKQFSLKKTAAAYAIAALPIVSVPIKMFNSSSMP